MKYLVIEIQKFANDQMSTPTYAYDSQNSAEAKYHTILAAAANSQLPVHSALLINEEGNLIRYHMHSCGSVLVTEGPGKSLARRHH